MSELGGGESATRVLVFEKKAEKPGKAKVTFPLILHPLSIF